MSHHDGINISFESVSTPLIKNVTHDKQEPYMLINRQGACCYNPR